MVGVAVLRIKMNYSLFVRLRAYKEFEAERKMTNGFCLAFFGPTARPPFTRRQVQPSHQATKA